MKRSLLTITALLITGICGSLYAQQGLKIGGFLLPQSTFLLNADDMALDVDQYQLEFLGGMAGGAIVGYNFNDVAGVRLNVLYSQQGGKYSTRRNINFRNNYVTRLEYLKIPLMFGFNTNPANKKAMFTFYAGAQVGFLTRAFSHNDDPVFDPGLPDNITNFPKVSETYENVNLSLVGDIGFDIYLTPEAVLNLHLRTDYGVTNSENTDASYLETSGGATLEKSYWQLIRGASATAETRGLTAGLMIGITYTFVTY